MTPIRPNFILPRSRHSSALADISLTLSKSQPNLRKPLSVRCTTSKGKIPAVVPKQSSRASMKQSLANAKLNQDSLSCDFDESSENITSPDLRVLTKKALILTEPQDSITFGTWPQELTAPVPLAWLTEV